MKKNNEKENDCIYEGYRIRRKKEEASANNAMKNEQRRAYKVNH